MFTKIEGDARAQSNISVHRYRAVEHFKQMRMLKPLFPRSYLQIN